ncbi:MAG: DUF4469 domain-containing protein [Treponema sp.]|nr:DUF4469 domain-containing protein [Treponema sp.]
MGRGEDKTSAAINPKFSPGHGVQISGKTIKITGTDSSAGIHLIDESGNAFTAPSLRQGPSPPGLSS